MKTTDTSVYEILRNKIINLQYRPGQELNVNSLSEELGVSRSPIRDALLRLELDKLVDIFPQRGTRVSFLDKNIIKQERFMRINLELGVLKMFMMNLRDENKRNVCSTKLQAILLKQHASLMDGNKLIFLEDDDELHHFFYRETGNQWIWDIIRTHTGNDHRIRILSYNAKDIAEHVEDEHQKLVEAIKDGNMELACRIDEEHLQRLTEVLDTLNKIYPEYFSSNS